MLDFTQEPGEKVLIAVRKHPLVLVGALIPYAILDYLPYLLPRVGEYIAHANPTAVFDFAELLSFDNPWTRFIVGIYWLFVWMGAFGALTDHYLDHWIVTTKRILDVEQETFWRRQVSSLSLTSVEDVDVKVYGFFNTLFNFGTIIVESAGAEIGKTQMSGVTNPSHIRDLILKEAHEARVGEYNAPVGK